MAGGRRTVSPGGLSVPARLAVGDDAEEAFEDGSPRYAGGNMLDARRAHARRSIRWGGSSPFVIPTRDFVGPATSPLSPLLSYVQDTGRPLTWSVLVSFEFDTGSFFTVNPSVNITLTAWLKVGVGQANVPMVKRLVTNTRLVVPTDMLPAGTFIADPTLIQWDVVPAENIQVQAMVSLDLVKGGPWTGTVSSMAAPYFMQHEEHA